MDYQLNQLAIKLFNHRHVKGPDKQEGMKMDIDLQF